MPRKSLVRAAVPALVMAAAACAETGTDPTPVPSAAAVRVADTPVSLAWQERARGLVAANRLSALAGARVYAGLSVAQYQAVRAVNHRSPGGHRSDLVGLLRPQGPGHEGRPVRDARRGAVAGASATVLSFLFPAAANDMEQAVRDQRDTEGPAYTWGVGEGNRIGAAIVERLKHDGFTTPWTGSVPVGPGVWIANGPPVGATFGGVLPWFLLSGSQFRPDPPPAFGSPSFLADLDEIRTLAATRTEEQRSIALKWNFPAGSFTAPGFWNLVTSNYVAAYSLDERAATRAFALTSGAVMDALIACWDAKYYYWTIRPSQADPGISLTFALPNHPSYPSGHSCGAAAAATVLSHLFPRQRAELGAWVAEAGESRLYAGIHYRFDIVAAARLGTAVGRWALRHPARVR